MNLPKDFIVHYLQKSGDNPDFFFLEFDDATVETHESGFATWRTVGKVLIIGSVYGDGEYWERFFLDKAKELGCKKIMWASFRLGRKKAFERRFKCKAVGYIFERDAK